jgi:hypothetical protein
MEKKIITFIVIAAKIVRKRLTILSYKYLMNLNFFIVDCAKMFGVKKMKNFYL